MSIARARSLLSALLVGAAATLGGAGPAQAAVYTGNWDPAFGGIFPSLGWQASAVFDVPDACLALGNVSGDPHSVCAGFDILSAKLEFYNSTDPLHTVLQTFNLNPDVTVTGIAISGSRLTGIDTLFFDSVIPTLAIAGGGNYAFSLILFGGDLAQLIYANPTTRSPACDQFPVAGATCGHSANVAHAVFAPIPEPETYALMLAGLGALGFVARRRRRS
jgi:hypothetical protein